MINLVQNLNVLVDKIGGAEDTEEFKNDMSKLIQESNSLSKSTSSLIKSLVTLSNDNVRFFCNIFNIISA